MYKHKLIAQLILACTFGPILIFLVGSKRSQPPSLELKLASIKPPGQLIVNMNISPGSIMDLRVPEPDDLLVGYEDDTLADCFFVIYRLVGNKEIKQTPSGDYQTYNLKKRITNLATSHNLEYRLNILPFYQLDLKSSYKICVRFRLSKYNATEDIQSNWLYINKP
jgi:hypothetical protein